MKERMTPEKIISELTYVSYATQRDNAPEISPERWATLYGKEAVEVMEKRYQEEK